MQQSRTTALQEHGDLDSWCCRASTWLRCSHTKKCPAAILPKKLNIFNLSHCLFIFSLSAVHVRPWHPPNRYIICYTRLKILVGLKHAPGCYLKRLYQDMNEHVRRTISRNACESSFVIFEVWLCLSIHRTFEIFPANWRNEQSDMPGATHDTLPRREFYHSTYLQLLR